MTTRPTVTTPPGWNLVVPVKSLRHAKSRLAPALDPDGRRALVLAMAEDTVRSCHAVGAVGEVTVVTPDPDVASLMSSLGARVVRDPAGPGPTNGSSGLLPALRSALPPTVNRCLGIVSADLPLLTPTVLVEILLAATRYPASFLADHHGVGTTMAFWTPSDRRATPVPRFGPGSANAFAGDGAVPLVAPEDRWAGARLDLDDPEDLRRVPVRGAGPRTASVLTGLNDVAGDRTEQ